MQQQACVLTEMQVQEIVLLLFPLPTNFLSSFFISSSFLPLLHVYFFSNFYSFSLFLPSVFLQFIRSLDHVLLN